MKKLKKILSVLALIVLVGSDFLTSISYALDDMLDDSVVVQIENEEAESVENEEENVDKEDSEIVYEDENMEEEKLETENSAGDIIEEWTGEVSEIGSGEVKELTEETVEGITGDVEGVTGDVEELTGEVVESTEIGEETVIEDMTYNEEPITGEKTYNDVTVRVEALSGTFPEGTELKIEPIKWWSLSSLKDKLVEEKEEIKEDTTIVAFDITFKYEGEEVQPKDGEKVKVTFDYSRNEDLVKADKNENQEVSVYHIDDETNEGTEIDIVNKDGDEVEILATEFSTYTIVVQRLEETPEGQPTQTRKYGKDYFIISIAKPSSITETGLPEGIIIMDRNLGATATGYGDGASTDSYGYKYQWGNNYGFSDSATVIPIDTCLSWNSNYNHNGYVSKDWINGSNCNNDVWGSTSADHYDGIWGGENDNIDNRQGVKLRNYAERQGPCPSGWHVPSAGEWGLLIKYWGDRTGAVVNNGYDISSNRNNRLFSLGDKFSEFQQYFNLPFAGRRLISNANLIDESVGHYWSSSPSVDSNLASNLYLGPSAVSVSKNIDIPRGLGYSVRCFKDDYVVPKTNDVTFEPENGSGATTVQVEDGETTTALNPEPTKDGYAFLGWYLSGAESAFDFTGTAITGDITLYAKWLADFVRYETIDDVDVNVNINAKGGTFPEGTELFIELVSQDRHDEIHTALVNDMGKNLELLAFDIYFMSGGVKQQPTTGVLVKLNYEGNPEFQGASLSDLSLYHIDGTTHELEPIEIVSKNGDEIEFWATEFSEYLFVLQEGEYIVSFVSDDVEVGSGIAVSGNVYTGIIPTPTKDGYNFSGWYLTGAESAFDFSGTAITGDITLYAKWEEGEGVMYTISFDTNRGTFANLPTPQSVASGSLISAPTQQQTPELPGYTFTGWWTEPRGGTQWDFGNDLVTGNITLYAHWIYDLPYGDLDVYMIDSNGSLIKYVMMDRNLGATGVYNKNFDSQNPSSFGFVYQWGNNYGFPRCNGNGTCNYSPITDTQVSVDIVENYIPSKFASSTWIGKNGSNGSKKSWYVSDNTLNHLWGNANTTDRQGPCPDGYHVPLTSETNDEGGLFRVWGNIYDKTINRIEGNGSGFSFLSDDQKLFTFQFLLPNAGAHKKGNTKEQEQNMCGDYWTATPSGTEMARNMWFCKDGQSDFYKKHGNFLFTNNSQRNNGSTLRCFKNSTDSANLDIVNGGKKGLITVHKVDGVTTINAIKEPENTDANGTGLIFGGWYTSQNFEPSTMKTGGDTLSASVTTLYAKWDCPDGLVYNSDNECISGVLVRFMDGETEYTRSVVISGEEVSAPAINPIKAGHIFTGWFESGANLPFVFTGTPITGNLDLYAHWEDLPETEALITVNYYLKNLDVENNKLTGGVIKYSTGVEFIGEIGDTINISGTYLTGVVGYYFDHATVFSGEDEILADEIYLEGNKEVNMYYIPEQNQFTLNTVPYSSTEGSSTGGMYYYGAKVILSGASSDDHYLWSGWDGLPEGTPNSAQTDFFMPNSEVTVTSSVREKIYDEYTVTFENRNGSVLWSGKVISGEIPVYSGSQPSRPATEETVYIFTGWYPELHPATHDETYIAVYTEGTRYYTVTLTGTPAGYGTLSPESLSGEYGAAIVISGDKLTVGGTEVILTGNEGYEFQEWTGTCGKVGKQVCDEFTVYSHPEPIEFTGGNNLIITDPGYDLFSESNYQKDFEISFDIVDQDLSSSVNQATILNVKDEDQENIYPGFAIRKSSSAGKIEITATSNYGKGYKTNKNYSLENLHSIKISRINSILYVSINGSENEQLYDYSGFNNYFTKPIIFGSSYQSGNMFRPAKITLSNILIKTIDTTSCYTGNVYVVTGDCQMTAKYANWTPSKYEVTGSVAAGQENMGYLSGATSTGTSLTGLYNLGTNLVVIAVPTLGYLFDYWEVNGFTGDNLPEGVTTSENQLTIIVNQILDIIAHFKPSNHTPYTVEHYKQNVGQTGYDFEWSGTMYGTTNASTNATGIDYEGFTLSGNLVDYQTGINADGSTVIRLYYDRNVYTITWNNWNGSGITTTPAVYGAHPEFARDGWPQRYRADDEVQYLFIFTGWSRSGSSEIIRELTGLTTEIVTGDTTYIAQYDQTYRSFEVRYHPNEGTGNMENQTFQLYTSGALNSNNFIRTGYEFDGWLYYYADDATGFYENGQTINIEKDYVKGDRERELGLLYFDLYAQWKPSTDVKVTVNYYLKDLDADNNVLINSGTEYATGVGFTGTADSVVESILATYGTGIEGYEYSKSIVYGSDYPGGVETGTTTILANGSRVIDMYYVPRIYQFTLNFESHSSTAGSSVTSGYYYGANVRLSGDSNDDCFTWSGWTASGITLSDNTVKQTLFTMPANNVEATPTTTENTYNIIFNGNGSNSGTMSPMNGIRCTESTGLTLNAFGRTGHTFTGWSTTIGGSKEYVDGATVDRLSTGADVNLYAVWDINEYNVNASVAAGGEGYLSGMGNTGISLTGLYDFGESLVVIAIPELGYLFDYWEVNGSVDAETGNQLTIIVDQILDIVAHFKENVGTVTVNYYNMNTGGVYLGVTSTATFTGLVGYTGYATVQPPVGFYLDTTSTVNTGIVISENNAENVINIYYARNKHNITLGYAVAFLNPGSVTVIPTPRESGYYYGEDVHFEAIVSTGYVFKQWRVNGVPVAGGADGVDFIMGDEDVELVVDGDLITYNIDYYTDPGSTDPMNPNPQTYTVLSGEIEIHNPIAEFCNDFLGWTGGTTGDWILTPTTGLVIDSSKGGDRKYYANWERKSYEVELSVDPSSGGTVTGEGTYRCMGEIELHATPNTGYHFVGWYDTGGNIVSSNSMYFFRGPVGSLGTGLTAKFEINQYYVNIDKVGSGWFQPESAASGWYNHGSEITVSASPAYGYKLQKWSKNGHYVTGENGELYTGIYLALTVTETGYITVYYEPETYNIIYMDGDSILSGLTPSTYTVENHVYSGDLPTITKNGYIFEGWFTEYPRQQYNRVQEIGEVPVNGESVTIYAGWTPVDYDINYYLLSGEIINREEYYPYEFYQSYTVETSGTNLPIPQKSGYVFSGWMNHGEYISTFGGGMTGNLDLYPTWRSAVMDITVNYYEMNTSGKYYPSEYTYYTGYHYTGFTESEFIVPDYTTTGFSFDYYVSNGYTGYSNPTLVVSGNENANVIDVYYKRHHNYVQVMGDPGSNINVSSCSGYSGEYYYNCEYYFGQEVTIQHGIYDYDEGYEYSGWYVDSEYPLPDGVELTTGGVTFNMPDHDVHLYLYTNHILYKLTFTGYEGSEVTNSEYIYVNLTGENYLRFDTEFELPNLNKPGYNFLGWNSGNYNVWSPYYTLYPDHPTWHMPSHDVELTAVFSGRTDMNYIRQYYLQDIEGTGYTLSGDLTDFGSTGVTNQEIPGRYGGRYVTGFEYTGFGYSGEITNSWELRPYIKATGDNSVDYYYDRNVSLVDVLSYDDGILSVIGTGYYRYEAPVTLTFITKTGYEFSGIGYTSLYPDYDTGNSISFIMPDGGVIFDAYSKPIEYSIEYELNGGYPTPYGYLITGYTVEDELAPFDLYKDGYTFLGWTGGVIGVWELTEPTTGLIIPQGSIGNRKYFANWEPAEVDITVNYHLKKIDAENNELLDDSVFFTGKTFTGLTDDIVDISEAYGTGIEGYSYTTAIVYGPDLPGGVEIGTTTVLSGRSIDIYYTPIKYDFTVVAGPNTTTSGTSISTGYYYGAYVTLSGDSTDDCFEWDKWGSTTLPEGKNQQHTTFDMPAHDVTVEAMVTEKSYNITFDANGGSGTMEILPVQCTSGTLIANSFERDGYTFTGWSRNAEGPVEFTGGADIYRLSTESGGSVTLFAIWDVNWYTVTFDLSGGSLTGDMTLTKEYTIETPSISLIDYIPVRNGYTFTGWYKGGTLTNNIAGGETGDYTLTANWEADNVFLHISYLGEKLEGGDYYIMSESGAFPKVDSFYEAEIKEFSGFIYDPTCPRNITGRIVSWDEGQNDIQIYYKRIAYPVTITNDGEGTTSETTGGRAYLYEEPVMVSVKALTGWEFVDWTVNEGDLSGVDLSGTTLSFNMPAEPVKVSPNLNHIKYEVTFDAGLGTAVASQTYYYDDVLSGLDSAVTTRDGYTFAGWYLSGVLYTSGSTMPAENITLTAKWTPRTGIQYQVNHRGENVEGTAYDVELSGYTMYGTSDSQTIAESGNFAGFTLSGNVDQKIINPNGTTVVDIYYNRNVYTISLNNNGGTGVTEITGKYEAPVTVHEPTRLGYEFAGWDPNIPSTMPLSGWSATAKWNAGLTQYTVNYHIEKVQAGEYDIYTGIYTGETDSSPWIPLLNPSLTGFITPAQFTGKIIPEGAEFDYYYNRNSYMLYYDTAGGTPLSGRLFRYGEKILTGETERPGYTLITWNNIPEDGNMPAQSGLTLVALREPNAHTKYTVYHLFEDLSGGYTTGDFENLSGTTDTPTAAAPKHIPGYESHFDIGDASHTGDQVNIDGDGNAHVEIYYDRIVYQIDFDMNGGDAIEGTGVKFGTYIKSFIDSLNPHKQGYAFSGWNPEFPTTMPDHNLTGMAMWRPTTGEYKVEFYYQLANGTYPGTATSGEFRTGNTEWTGRVTDSDKQPAINGYTFDSTNTGNILEGEIVGDGSLILKVYFKKQFTVRYLTGSYGRFGIETYEGLDYGVETPVFGGSTGSHESGYTFNGWFPEWTGIVTNDVDYEAKWRADTDTEFKVEYYLQNVDDDGYIFVETGVETGITNTTGYADTTKEFTGFAYSGGNENNVTSGVIAGDGSLVLKLYYDRKVYEVTTGGSEHGSVSGETGSQRYGKVITFIAHPDMGYILDKWYKNGEEIEGETGNELTMMVEEGMEITGHFIAKEDTPYYVEYYKENLNGGYDVRTGTYSGTTDQSATAKELSFTGFTYESGNEKNVTTGNIDGDGSRVLKMYYNREIYTITWLNEDGTGMDTTTVKYGEVPTHADPTQPADAHYTYNFKGWDPEPTFATGEISYRATYEYIANKYTITWKNDDGSLIDTTLVEYGTIPTHTKPTKAETEDYRYIFAGWDPEVVAVVGDAEYTAIFNAEEKEKSSKGGGMSGGGGRGGNIDNSDNQHGSAEENLDGDEYTGDEVVDDIDKDIDRDIVPLYKRTYENNVTTMDTLEDADPDGLLTRGHLAKMVVNYMVNVLGRKIPYDVTYNCRYWGDDESSWESDEIRDYATKACAFGVMGINMEDNKFLPNSIVTRAEFGTVMSRVLRGDKYNITDTDNRSYYENHLQALKKDNILTQIINPETRWEIRKWVWLVFRRIVEKYKK